MHLIHVQTAHPMDFEDFPQGCARSVQGALRMLPGATLEITAGELAELQAAGIPLRVLRAPPVDPPQALPLPADLDDKPDDPAVKAPPARRNKGKATA